MVSHTTKPTSPCSRLHRPFSVLAVAAPFATRTILTLKCPRWSLRAVHRYPLHGTSIILALKRMCSTKFVVHPAHRVRQLISHSYLGASGGHTKGRVCEEVGEVRRHFPTSPPRAVATH